MKKPSSYLNFFPLILGVAGAVALCSYISPWAAVKPDSTIYLRMAEEIQKGYWHIDQWGRGAYSGVPMYPMLVALVEWVIPGLETAGTLAAIMPAAIVVVPLFFLARHFYGKKAAWIVIPLTIFNPWYLAYAPDGGIVYLTISIRDPFAIICTHEEFTKIVVCYGGGERCSMGDQGCGYYPSVSLFLVAYCQHMEEQRL